MTAIKKVKEQNQNLDEATLRIETVPGQQKKEAPIAMPQMPAHRPPALYLQDNFPPHRPEPLVFHQQPDGNIARGQADARRIHMNRAQLEREAWVQEEIDRRIERDRNRLALQEANRLARRHRLAAAQPIPTYHGPEQGARQAAVAAVSNDLMLIGHARAQMGYPGPAPLGFAPHWQHLHGMPPLHPNPPPEELFFPGRFQPQNVNTRPLFHLFPGSGQRNPELGQGNLEPQAYYHLPRALPPQILLPQAVPYANQVQAGNAAPTAVARNNDVVNAPVIQAGQPAGAHADLEDELADLAGLVDDGNFPDYDIDDFR